MMEKTLEGDFEYFDRSCAALESGLVKGEYDERSTCIFMRAAATVTLRRIGKERMSALLREICADLDLVSVAPSARPVKEQGSAARLSAKMFRAARAMCIALLMSSLSRLEKSTRGFAACAKNFCKRSK